MQPWGHERAHLRLSHACPAPGPPSGQTLDNQACVLATHTMQAASTRRTESWKLQVGPRHGQGGVGQDAGTPSCARGTSFLSHLFL